MSDGAADIYLIFAAFGVLMFVILVLGIVGIFWRPARMLLWKLIVRLSGGK